MLRPRRKRSGLTLIEMMVVVAIILVMLGLAMTNFLAARPLDRLNEASRDMVMRLLKARTMAVNRATGDPTFPDADFIRVSFDQGAGTYSVTGVDPTGVPKVLQSYALASYRGATLTMAVTITPTPVTPVQFQYNGSTDRRATIVITETNINQARRVEITRAGLVRLAP